MFVDVVILCTFLKKKYYRSLSYFKFKLLIMFFILKLYYFKHVCNVFKYTCMQVIISNRYLGIM